MDVNVCTSNHIFLVCMQVHVHTYNHTNSTNEAEHILYDNLTPIRCKNICGLGSCSNVHLCKLHVHVSQDVSFCVS